MSALCISGKHEHCQQGISSYTTLNIVDLDIPCASDAAIKRWGLNAALTKLLEVALFSEPQPTAESTQSERSVCRTLGHHGFPALPTVRIAGATTATFWLAVDSGSNNTHAATSVVSFMS